MPRKPFRIALVIAIAAAVLPVCAETVTGRVVGITDGDTIKVLTEDHTQLKVRLAEIDAPEKGQPYGRQAKEALSHLCFGKEATLEVSGKDRYGRLLAGVTCAGESANERLVREGYAWVYRRYSTNKNMIAVEIMARSTQTGLWSDENPIPPWDWRRTKKQ